MSTHRIRRLSWIAILAPSVVLLALVARMPGVAAEDQPVAAPAAPVAEQPAVEPTVAPATPATPTPAIPLPAPVTPAAASPLTTPMAPALTLPVPTPAAPVRALPAPDRALAAVAPPTTEKVASAANEMVTQPVEFKVTGPSQRLEMIVNSSRMLTLGRPIPQAQVGDKSILSITPMNSKQIQIYAKKPGVTQVNLWDDQEQVYSIDVLVATDVRELASQLRAQFPDCAIRVYPTPNSIILRGYVDRPDDVSRIIAIAKEYNPNVINNMRVGGAQQVLLYVTIAEVNRTKLRKLGVDFANVATGGSFAISSISGLLRNTAGSALGSSFATSGNESFSYGIVGAGNSFFSVIEAMSKNQLVKVLASPTLTAISGTPASFQVGGELPILVPAGLGTVSIEFKPFGTQLDYVAIVQGNGTVHLDVRPRITEPDFSLSVTLSGNTVPSFKSREINTSAELKFGQTLALAGLVQSRADSSKTGLPWLCDLPIIGVPFRRMQETTNEVELLILVRPELVEPMDCEQVPPCLPTESTRSPRDWAFYWQGQVEVPAFHVNPDGMMVPDEEYQPEEIKTPAGTTPPAPGESSTGRRPQDRRTTMTQPPQRGDSIDLAALPQPPFPAPTPAGGGRSDGEPSSDGSRRSDPNNRSNLQARRRETPANQKTPTPGFIGPVGYDLHK